MGLTALKTLDPSYRIEPKPKNALDIWFGKSFMCLHSCDLIVNELILKDSRDVILFRIGTIGYIVGFLAWLFWLLLVVANLVIDWHGQLSIMSGIFFQSYSRAYFMIDYSLFSVSFALGSFGCFGLKKKYDLDLALACGISHIIVAAILVYSLSSLYLLTNYVPMRFYVPTALFVGMLMWGGTLLIEQKPFQSTMLGSYTKLNQLAGTLFMVSSLIGILFHQVILYWGIEFWLMFAGWLYAAGAVATALLLFRISKA